MTTNIDAKNLLSEPFPTQHRGRTGKRALLASVLLAAFAALVTPELSLAQATRAPQPVTAQPAPEKSVVRCTADISAGETTTTKLMTCQTNWFGVFTSVPSGQFFSITDVSITPISSASASVSGIFLRKLGGTGSFGISIHHTGGSTYHESYRTPPMVLAPGSQLNIGNWDSNTNLQVVVTGLLTSDPDGGAQ